jgi:thioredoxin-related protein
MKGLQQFSGFLKVVILLTIFCGEIAAQSGVKFRELSFNEALKTSAREKRPVFLHGYATWCHYCEYMRDSVYTNPAVGEFFNKNFINIKMDLEKEGKQLNASSIRATSFPVLIVYDSTGKTMHRLAGKKDAQDLIAFGQDALDPQKQLMTFEKYYRSGKATPAQAYQYFGLLKRAGMENQAQINAYFDKVPDSAFVQQPYWRILYDQYNDVEKPLMMRFVKMREPLGIVYTPDSVENRIITSYINSLMSKVQKLDTLGYNEQVRKLRALNDPLFDKITELSALNRLKLQSKYDEYLKLAPPFVKKYCFNDYRRLNEVAQTYYERASDTYQLQEAVVWAERSVKLNDSNRNNYTLAALHYKLGHKEEALKTAEHALAVVKPGQSSKETALLIDKIRELP